MSITPAGKWLCHSMQFAAMLTVLTNLVQCYVYLCTAKRHGTYWECYGPLWCIAIATLLLMVHPTVFLLRDLKLIPPVCQTKWGLRELYFCTHFGFINLFTGVMWETQGFQAICNAVRKAASMKWQSGHGCCGIR